jgi:hypothetical protein
MSKKGLKDSLRNFPQVLPEVKDQIIVANDSVLDLMVRYSDRISPQAWIVALQSNATILKLLENGDKPCPQLDGPLTQ